ncbi:MAG: hypothetical protein J7574_11305 [Flavobacterium sp.]|uniref:hypothetical protein n=1 Tax=Flavobacterium sp. TaxID=239 RepID=UPI001B14D081|nr:hypothetical protein [Flavobacterium sp.]MBO9584735.1 hypothetical protein [Flavobacterium sp.]
MIISFDLDDTLISSSKFDSEKTNLFHKLFSIEKLRKGTVGLFRELKRQQHRIYIYTTSYRSIIRIKWMFYFYGVSVDYIINEQKHLREIKKFNFRCTKFPPIFGIDVHIDDSEGIKIEGEKYGFKTIVISEKDENWSQTILDSLKLIP